MFRRLWLHPVFPFLCLAVLGFLPYANGLFTPFVWDDFPLVADNPFVHDLRHVGTLWAHAASPTYFTLSGEAYFRPMVTMSYIVDWAVWGGNPLGLHLTNVLLHVAVTLLFAQVVRRIIGRTPGTIAGALFAVHPIHTETVTLVTGRVDLWPALGMLVALWLVFHGRAAGRWWPWVPLAAVSYVLALLGKEMAAPFPAMLLLLEVAGAAPLRRHPVRARWQWHLPFWLVLGLYMLWRFGLMDSGHTAESPFGGAGIVALLSTVVIVGQYLTLFVLPVSLSPYHDLPWVLSLGEPQFLLAALGLLSLTALAWRCRTRAPVWLWCWVAFWVLLSPVLNLVPIFMPIAERYLYIPSMAACAAAGAALVALARALRTRTSPAAAWVPAVLVVAVLAGRTVLRNQDYTSEYRFYQSAAAVGGTNSNARVNYALAAQAAGEYAIAQREYEAALEVAAAHPHALRGLSEVLFLQGRNTAALLVAERAVAADPENWQTHYNTGAILLQGGDPVRAVPAFMRAHQYHPGSGRVRIALVRALQAAGQMPQVRIVCAWPPPDDAESAARLREICAVLN